VFEIVQHPDGTVNIGSVAFPGVFLRMDGTGVNSWTWNGGGTVNCQFGAGSWETFTLRSVDGQGLFNIESVAFPNVYLRLEVESAANCQYTPPANGKAAVDWASGPGPEVAVPDLVNLSPAQAFAVYRYTGLATSAHRHVSKMWAVRRG